MAVIEQQVFKLKNNQEITIRSANEIDAQAVLDHIHTVAGESDFLTFGPGDFKKTLEEEKVIIKDHKDSDNQVFVVGEIEGQIVSVMNLQSNPRPRRKHQGEFGISVAKQYWGIGVGKIMVKALIDWAYKSKVVRKINLFTVTTNTKAIKLYEGLGFKHEGITTRDLYLNGEFIDAHMMGMNIDPITDNS